MVGAGPGDPDLLTLRAARLLQRADVLLYDQLLHPAVMSHAREDAEKIDVGKTYGKKVMPQEDIQRLLIRKAKEGKQVLRLKGGDPFIFGRGGEEAMALRKAGVDFEIVPGVTSAIAVPAYAGIPVTFRGVAASCAIITGHEDPLKEKSDICWEQLAKGLQTLVFLMGTRNLDAITGRLTKAGRAKSTPCAVISHGTYPDQRVVTGTLGNIAAKAQRAALPTPTILVVGDAVRLRKDLQWFEERPLLGKSVIVTRAREQASDLVQQLERLGARAYEAPSIRIEPPADYEGLDQAIRALASYDWVFFTSVNGVKSFLSRAASCGVDLRRNKKWKIGVIGPASQEPLLAAGLKTDLLPKRFVAEGIVEEIDSKKINFAGKKVLLVRAEEVRPLLADALRDRNAQVDEAVAYRTVPETEGQAVLMRRLAGGHIDWITFTSSSTVKNFFALGNGKSRPMMQARTRLASIGPITSQTLRSFGHEPSVEASEHTIPGLVKAVLNAEKGKRRAS